MKLCFSANSISIAIAIAIAVAIAVDGRQPRSWVICFNVTSYWFNRPWYSKMISFFFCKERDTILLRESVSVSRNWIWWEGFTMDFWNSARNPSLCNMKVNVSLDTVIFSNELPSVRCLPDKWSTECSNFSLLQLEYSLVLWKFSEHALGQSTGREIRKDLLATETLHISGKLFEVLLKNRHFYV